MHLQSGYLEALHETSLALMNRLDLADLLQTIVTRAGQLVGTPHGYIYLIEDDYAEIKVGTGLMASRVGFRVAYGQGMGGTVWQTGRPLVINDVAAWHNRAPAFDYDVMRAITGVPLKRGDDVQGIIGLVHLEPGRGFGPDEIWLLERFAELASIALDNARLYTAAQQELAERTHAEARWRQAEVQYHSIFEASSDGMVIYDMAGRVVEANHAACLLHGYAVEEFVGHPAAKFIHPDYHDLIPRCIALVAAGRQFDAQAIALRKDGSEFRVEARITSLQYDDAPHMLAVIRDITERVEAYQLLEQRVQERTRELTTLLDVSHSVASTLELRPLVGLILDQLKSVVDYDGATIFTAASDEIHVLDYRGPIPYDEVLGYSFQLDAAGADREVIRRHAPVIIGDVRGDEPLALAFQRTAGERLDTTYGYIRSWMGVPLLLKDRIVGLLTLDNGAPDFYTARHAKLALAIANQAAVAIENARLYEQAQELAVMMERQRIARELHDSVSQALYGIALGARTARTLLDGDAPKVVEALDYVLSLAQAGLAEIRALIFELRPEALETEGLVGALTKQAVSLRARYGVEVLADLSEEPDVRAEIKEALYRIGQEAMHNTVKHARATEVELRLAQGDDELTLEVRDNGIGFDPHRSYPGHLGLKSMRERAARLGGTLTFDSAPGCGASIQARFPLLSRRSKAAGLRDSKVMS